MTSSLDAPFRLDASCIITEKAKQSPSLNQGKSSNQDLQDCLTISLFFEDFADIGADIAFIFNVFPSEQFWSTYTSLFVLRTLGLKYGGRGYLLPTRNSYSPTGQDGIVQIN